MLNTRIIPCLLLKGQGLVKTIGFKNPTYVGDPINAIKIFNDKEVDELVLLDIDATINKRGPAFDMIREVASECFMPLGYGGGISTIAEMRTIFAMGVEKVILNTSALNCLNLISEAATEFGSQSIVVAIDIKKSIFGKYNVFSMSGTKKHKIEPEIFAVKAEAAGAGEILLNSIDNDGKQQGFDLELIKRVSESVNIPVVACGGAGTLSDLRCAVHEGKASAVAAGSLFVFHGPHRAVLINYPTQEQLRKIVD